MILFALLVALGMPVLAFGGAYMSKKEALELAFPEAERVETLNLYLDETRIRKVSRLSGIPAVGAIHTFYVGKKGDLVTGYAAIEAAVVRTLPETLMIVLDPDGHVRRVEVLAFYEPEEYKPPVRWLAQFEGRILDSELRVGGAIHGITGATLSAQAVTRQVRKTVALLRVLREE